MNSTTLPGRERRRLWVFVFGAMAGAVLLAGFAAYNLFTLTTEAAVLRRELFAGAHRHPSFRMQATVGRTLLGAAGVVLRFVPDAPVEAREALAALDAASIGIYEFAAVPSADERNAMFAAADSAMERRGWVRIVGATQRGQSVAVYTPAADMMEDKLRVCVAILDRKQLMVLSARADARQVSEFAQRRLPPIPIARTARR